MSSTIQSVLGAKSVPPPKTTPPNLGPQYQQMLDSNPYRNQTYNETPWQTFLSSLGFRTQADAWRENMSVQAAEYDASIAQKAYDESYNTPAMQAERMRAAGLNPDINGGQGINPGEAAPLGQDPSTPMQSTGAEGTLGEAVGVMSSVVNIVMSGFSDGVGLVQSLQGIRSNKLNNTLLSIRGEQEFQNFVESQWKNFLPDFPTDEVMQNGWNWKTAAQNNARRWARGNLPKKFQDKFLSSIERFWENGPKQGQAYGEWLNEVRNMKNYSLESQTFFSQIPNVLDAITAPLAEAIEKVTKHELSARDAVAGANEAQAKNDKEYYDTLDAGLQAEVENKSNQAESAEFDMKTILNEALDGMVAKLKKVADQGGWEGSVARFTLAGVGFARLWLANLGSGILSRSSNGNRVSPSPSASGGGFEIIRDSKFGW